MYFQSLKKKLLTNFDLLNFCCFFTLSFETKDNENDKNPQKPQVGQERSEDQNQLRDDEVASPTLP